MKRGAVGGRAAAAGVCLVGRIAPLCGLGLTGCARFCDEEGGDGRIDVVGAVGRELL
jgi:hypothetical protein